MNEAKTYVMDALEKYKDSITILNEQEYQEDFLTDVYTASIQFANQHGDPSRIDYDVRYYIYSGAIDITIQVDPEDLHFTMRSESFYIIDQLVEKLHEALYWVE